LLHQLAEEGYKHALQGIVSGVDGDGVTAGCQEYASLQQHQHRLDHTAAVAVGTSNEQDGQLTEAELLPNQVTSNAVTRLDIAELFHLPADDAATSFGMAPTAFKKLCRSLGIKRWPYRKVMAAQNRHAVLQ